MIGAGYGDEGKGRVVDSLVSPSSIVVRFNGGSQAGHTVIRNGVRKTFSHVGSGTLQGARTFLSRHFVVHPVMFKKELEYLDTIHPEVLVSGGCRVTTPFDVALNRMAEVNRGADRHGSVGEGFGETIERCSNPRYGLFAGAVSFRDYPLYRNLLRILREWVPLRINALGIRAEVQDQFKHLLTEEVVEKFLEEDCQVFQQHTTQVSDDWLRQRINEGKRIVFEGAQGLLLDKDEGCFPHVTRSNTGLKNVRELLEGVSLKTMDVYYVTRAYTTRHGAGPLAHELPEGLPYEVKDPTNVPGEYQGTLRFSHLDLDTVAAAVKKDIDLYGAPGMMYVGVVTCLDQVPDPVQAHLDGGLKYLRKTHLVELFCDRCGLKHARYTRHPDSKTEGLQSVF